MIYKNNKKWNNVKKNLNGLCDEVRKCIDIINGIKSKEEMDDDDEANKDKE